jgi:hypothetical protein
MGTDSSAPASSFLALATVTMAYALALARVTSALNYYDFIFEI